MTQPRYLLDTNICIYIRRSRPLQVLSGSVASLRVRLQSRSSPYGELHYGAAKGAHQENAAGILEEFAEHVAVLPMPADAARVYGSLRALLERNGQVIGNNDLWIAAHALASRLTLVTNNESEFRRIPELSMANRAA